MLRTIEPLVRAGTIPRAVFPCARPVIGVLLRAEVARAGAADLVRIEAGELHGALRRARAAFSVSGTVLLDLLHHDVPATVVYRLGSRFAAEGKEHFLTAPWFASVNLLAGREVVPEFCFAGEGPRAEAVAALERCLDDGPWRRRCLDGLDLAALRLGPPGACERAAGQLLELAGARALEAAPCSAKGGPA
jgi:lipid A disaccharide synthetase